MKRNRETAHAYFMTASFLPVCLALAEGGCGPWRTAGNVLFSPDSQVVAFVTTERVDRFPPPDSPALLETASVHWAPASQPSQTRSVRLQTALAFQDFAVRLVFSADSRQLLAISSKTLTCIDLNSGTPTQLNQTGERVTAVAWLSNDQVGYAAHTNPRKDPSGRYGDLTDRTFWRQAITEPYRRKPLYRQSDVADGPYAGPERFGEHWSPDGRYVLFTRSFDAGPVQCLDVRAGLVREITSAESHIRTAIWKPDGSAVMCILWSRGRPRLQALLMNPATGESHDFTADFVETFGADCRDAEWTVDGQYLLINDSPGRGFCLLRPRPWGYIPIEELLVRRVGAGIHWIKVSPVPGRLIAWGDKGRPLELTCHYWSDYEAKQVAKLAFRQLRAWLHEAVSPDGRRVAWVEPPARLVVQPLLLESVSPAPPP